ncbi:tetratricopeptide repeat protein [bacterium]|nr:tetratricopeptide repeat protein [FCB group bacterium]MBL7191011.1 tetratricopeptide repeat protein [bacterium]
MRIKSLKLAIIILAMMGLINTAPAKSVEMRSAEIYFSQGDNHKAMEFFQKEVAQNPDNSKAYFNMGQIYREWSEYAKMSEMFDKSLAIKDKYKDKYLVEIAEIRDELWIQFFNAAVQPFNEGDFPNAINKFSLAVTVDPQKIDGWNQRGKSYLQLAITADSDSVKQAAFKSAIENFKKVIELDPKNEYLDARINLALVYYELEDYDNAVPALQTILKSDPENADAISKLALIYQLKGQSEKAIAEYNKALKIKPDSPNLLFNLGVLYFQMGEDIQKSVAEIEALKAENKAGQEQLNKLESLQKKKEDLYSKAINSFQKAAELAGDDVDALWNLVNSLWRIERYTQTIPHLEKITEFQPDDANAWQFLSIAYTKNGDFENGRAAFLKYKELSGK